MKVIEPLTAFESSVLDLVSGERVRIQILNADGSVKQEIFDVSVPEGKTANTTVSYTVRLAVAE